MLLTSIHIKNAKVLYIKLPFIIKFYFPFTTQYETYVILRKKRYVVKQK